MPYAGPVAVWFGLVPLSFGVSSVVVAIVLSYVAATELVKRLGWAKVPP